MRNVLSSLANMRRPLRAVASGRPEILRRRALVQTSRAITLASVLGTPFAVSALLHGTLLPFVLAILGLGTGVLGLALCQRRQYERTAAVQVYGTLMVGLVLAVADPAIADFGLAIALLAPVHASLLARSPVKKRAWVLLVGVVAFSAAASSGLLYWPEPHGADHNLLAALIFALTAGIIAYSAHRVNSVFEVYETAQINAYKHLIEHVQDAVMRFSAEGQVLFTSRSSERLFGCRRYELSGSGLIDRIHVLDRPIYMTAFSEANRDAKTRKVEVRMRRDDPEAMASAPQFIWVEVALSPVLEAGLRPERLEVVALLRDVTERRDIENEMRAARQLAEEASSAKSRFLATIGHELRTPLNAIVGFSEMMTSGVVGELSPVHREYAELIHQSGHHLIDVVRMLLDMSRIEAGKFELQTEAFQPDALLDPCLQMVDKLARDKKVTLRVELSRHLPMLTADERACRQILINLLSNAVKFSNEGSEVLVTMKRQGRQLAIAVTDHGIGMSPEATARIGEPFFQAEDGLSRGYEGTGLGLSIVKGLIDLHEGRLDIRSGLAEGTTMTVLLPLNGPATKLVETADVTQIRPEPVLHQMPEWREEKRKAQ